MQIGNRAIGPGEPIFIQAEVGVTHMGDLARALALVGAAAEAGADAVKFILTDPSTLTPAGAALDYTFTTPKGATTRRLADVLRDALLSEDAWREVRAYALQRGIIFYVTVDHPSGVEQAEALGVPAYKLCAWDIADLDLVAAIARTGKPMVADIGTAHVDEYETLGDYWRSITAADFVPIHGPHPSSDGRDWHLGRRLCGFSSPGRESWCDFVAVGQGAWLLEKRLTLDTLETRGHHHAIALNPEEFAAWVRDVRMADRALREAPYGGSEHAWAERAKWGGIRR